MAKKRPGRPTKADADKKARYLQVRVENAEKLAFDMAASSTGLDTSSWVRLRLREAARKDLSAAGAENPLSSGQSPAR